MKATSIVLFALVTTACLLPCLCAHAGPATIEVNSEPWYAAKVPAMGGLSLTRGYAPFPVFFEGWKSLTLRPDGSYFDAASRLIWDFGDGSPTADGFNAAHVYEVPGVYTVTLTATTPAGEVTTATLPIEVLAPDGKVFYVDSAVGDDANDGLSETTAWKTADKALIGIGTSRYKPGDRILFRRGQVFDLATSIVPGHESYGYGYSFGAFGEGARPIIKRTDTASTGEMLNFYGRAARHIGFADLVFDGKSLDGTRNSTVFKATAHCTNVLFLRCGMRNGWQHIGFNGPSAPAQNPISGAFVVDCDLDNAQHLSVYMKARRVVLMNTSIDRAGENSIYGAWMDRAVISGNTVMRTPFGRAALRISGASSDFNVPVEYVLCQDNAFVGWIDPIKRYNGNGLRWNVCLCTISPNVPQDQLIRYVWWRRNTVTGAETALQLGDVEDAVISGNTFDLPAIEYWSPRIKFGSPEPREYEHRPIKNVLFMDNSMRAPGKPWVFAFLGCEVVDGYKHTGIRILGNRIDCTGLRGPLYWTDRTDDTAPEWIAANSIAGMTRDKPNAVQTGGNWAGGIHYSLDEYFRMTGNDPPSGGVVTERVEVPVEVRVEVPVPMPIPEGQMLIDKAALLGAAEGAMGLADTLNTLIPAETP